MSLVLWVKWKGSGYCPVLIDDSGHIIPEVAEWLATRQPLCSPSSLDKKCRSLARFYDFWHGYGEAFKGDDLYHKFWATLLEGDPNLGWKALHDIKTARYTLRTVNEFTDWTAEKKNLSHPNPVQEQPLTWMQRLAAHARSVKTDFLAHLYSTTRRGQGFRQGRRVEPETRTMRRGTPHISRPTNVFEFENYIKLIEEETNPRNLCAWLLFGTGGPRISEGLHLFPTDIRLDDRTREARVVLADPQFSPITVNVGEKQLRITRKEYLKQQYGQVPRDLLNPHCRQFLGWKGMLIHDQDNKSSEVTWLTSDYGQLMWLASRVYRRLVLRRFPKLGHPWFFVNLQRNPGAVLTEGTVEQVFASACRRHGFKPPHHPHALRHMYIDILVNVFHVPLHIAQILARHRSPESTLLYAQSASLSTFQSQVAQSAGKLPTLRPSISLTTTQD